MNKADPNKVIDNFQARTIEALNDWKAIDAAVKSAGGAKKLGLRRRVAGDSHLALMSSWESFFSDWFVAAVNRQPSNAAVHLSNKLRTHAERTLRLPKDVVAQNLLATSHLNLESIRKIVDDKGRNVVFYDRDSLRKLADQWLADPYLSAAQTPTAFQLSTVVVGKHVRNALAHQSTSSLAQASAAVQAKSIPVGLRHASTRNLTVTGLRTYLLKEHPAGAVSRIQTYHTEIHALAGVFRVQ